MAISFTSVKCPECGASLPIEEGRAQIFCSYCGTNVLVTRDNERIYRHIDEAGIRQAEAGIKQAETEQVVRMRELELEEKNISNKRTFIIIWTVIVVLMLITSILMLLSWRYDETGAWLLFLTFVLIIGGAILFFGILPAKERNRIMLQEGGIRFPKGLEPISEQNYVVVRRALESAGFNNISCINLHDLTFGIFQKPGRIDTITVDGKPYMPSRKIYKPNVPITITYHGK